MNASFWILFALVVSMAGFFGYRDRRRERERREEDMQWQRRMGMLDAREKQLEQRERQCQADAAKAAGKYSDARELEEHAQELSRIAIDFYMAKMPDVPAMRRKRQQLYEEFLANPSEFRISAQDLAPAGEFSPEAMSAPTVRRCAQPVSNVLEMPILPEQERQFAGINVSDKDGVPGLRSMLRELHRCGGIPDHILRRSQIGMLRRLELIQFLLCYHPDYSQQAKAA